MTPSTPPPSSSVCIIDFSISSRAARPPRAFKLSPSQQAYVDCLAPPSRLHTEHRAIKATKVKSEGGELLQEVMRARKIAAGGVALRSNHDTTQGDRNHEQSEPGKA
eukprot:748450-Hanusia_phi.AAC.1